MDFLSIYNVIFIHFRSTSSYAEDSTNRYKYKGNVKYRRCWWRTDNRVTRGYIIYFTDWHIATPNIINSTPALLLNIYKYILKYTVGNFRIWCDVYFLLMEFWHGEGDFKPFRAKRFYHLHWTQCTNYIAIIKYFQIIVQV